MNSISYNLNEYFSAALQYLIVPSAIIHLITKMRVLTNEPSERNLSPTQPSTKLIKSALFGNFAPKYD